MLNITAKKEIMELKQKEEEYLKQQIL